VRFMPSDSASALSPDGLLRQTSELKEVLRIIRCGLGLIAAVGPSKKGRITVCVSSVIVVPGRIEKHWEDVRHLNSAMRAASLLSSITELTARSDQLALRIRDFKIRSCVLKEIIG